eukprot:jgi/Mesvir1/15081/Mv14725-RA.2
MSLLEEKRYEFYNDRKVWDQLQGINDYDEALTVFIRDLKTTGGEKLSFRADLREEFAKRPMFAKDVLDFCFKDDIRGFKRLCRKRGLSCADSPSDANGGDPAENEPLKKALLSSATQYVVDRKGRSHLIPEVEVLWCCVAKHALLPDMQLLHTHHLALFGHGYNANKVKHIVAFLTERDPGGGQTYAEYKETAPPASPRQPGRVLDFLDRQELWAQMGKEWDKKRAAFVETASEEGGDGWLEPPNKRPREYYPASDDEGQGGMPPEDTLPALEAGLWEDYTDAYWLKSTPHSLVVSARFALGQMRERHLHRRCEEKGLKPRGLKRDVILQLLHSPGELDAIWDAIGSILYPDKTQEERQQLVAPLREADRESLAHLREICRLASSKDTGSLPVAKRTQLAEMVVERMAEARQKDLDHALLQHQFYAHYHKALVARPLALILGQPGMREAFCGEPRLTEELRQWATDGNGFEPGPVVVARCALLSMLAGTPLQEEIRAGGEAKVATEQAESLQSILAGDDSFLGSLSSERLQQLRSHLDALDEIHGEVFGRDDPRAVNFKKALMPSMQDAIDDVLHYRQQQAVAAKFTGIPPQPPPLRNAKNKPAARQAKGKGKASQQAMDSSVSAGSAEPQQATKWWETPGAASSPIVKQEGQPPTQSVASMLAPAHVEATPPAAAPSLPGNAAQMAGADSQGASAPANSGAALGPTPVLIACYNYKGGVGKTSTAINLGFTLADKFDCRTCYVDCDPQCNLTTFFNTQVKRIDDPDKLEVDESEDDKAGVATSHRDCPKLDLFKLREVRKKNCYPAALCTQGSFDRNGREFETTVRKVLSEVYKGKPTPTGLLEFRTKRDAQGSEEYFGFKEGLFLLPGDKDLHHALESRLQQARANMRQAGQESSFWVLGGFRKALQDIGRAHGIEYMICDFGPSAGVMNETLVGSCDYVLPSFHADFFSASSVYGMLHSVLPAIISNRNEIVEEEARNLPSSEDFQAFRFNRSVPRVLPFLMTGFQIETVDKRPCVVADDAHFFDLVTDIVEDASVPSQVRQLYLRDGAGKMVTPFLRYVPIIQRTSQSLGHPAIGLSPEFVKALQMKRVLLGQAPRGMPAEFVHVRIAYGKLAKLVRHHCVLRA